MSGEGSLGIEGRRTNGVVDEDFIKVYKGQNSSRTRTEPEDCRTVVGEIRYGPTEDERYRVERLEGIWVGMVPLS